MVSVKLTDVTAVGFFSISCHNKNFLDVGCNAVKRASFSEVVGSPACTMTTTSMLRWGLLMVQKCLSS